MECAQTGWSRRDLIRIGVMLAAATGVPVSAQAVAGLAATTDSASRMLMRNVSQIVIPRTTTPGAGDVGCGDFVVLALAHGLGGSLQPMRAPVSAEFVPFHRTDGSLDYAGWLRAELDRRCNGSFMAQPLAAQRAAIGALDAQAFANDTGVQPWRTIKALILQGYYTSEAGGSSELRYEPLPGHYDPDVPVTPQTRAISNDWTAVDFG
ncbi:gluconate 2-dehydrogenase subunit 3 family protein [Novosphingobium sp.]|uniref:gluconate 2-dehydrogenase subunit 3 family protein n=1 Tax=Novosphingobium sp. TaxID=1874826 RepID=UPI003B52DB2F